MQGTKNNSKSLETLLAILSNIHKRQMNFTKTQYTLLINKRIRLDYIILKINRFLLKITYFDIVYEFKLCTELQLTMTLYII